MTYLIITTRYLLCAVSMLLTALFCIEFSHSGATLAGLLSLAAMVVVGVGLELSKYLFWFFRSRSIGYLISSVLLVLFSWSASLAFFISHEKHSLDIARLETTDYMVRKSEIEAIKNRIDHKSVLIERRLDSNYHAQWDEAAVLIDELNKLEHVLRERVGQLEKTGMNEAYSRVNTSALFLFLSNALNVGIAQVTIIAYGILALLVECCCLGTISLSKDIPSAKSTETKSTSRQRAKAVKKNPTIEQKMATLSQDIVSGIADPILLQIKRTGGYKLSEQNIRKVLAELKQQGVLIDGAKSLKLSQS